MGSHIYRKIKYILPSQYKIRRKFRRAYKACSNICLSVDKSLACKVNNVII